MAFDLGSSVPFVEAVGRAAQNAIDRFEQAEPKGLHCGPYRLGDRLGRGGMGAVCLAERVDTRNKIRLFLKVCAAAAFLHQNLVVSNIGMALKKRPAGIADQIKLVFVITDPARDTPAVLRRWLDHFDKRFIGLTGTEDALRAMDRLPFGNRPILVKHSRHRPRAAKRILRKACFR